MLSHYLKNHIGQFWNDVICEQPLTFKYIQKYIDWFKKYKAFFDQWSHIKASGTIIHKSVFFGYDKIFFLKNISLTLD